MKILILGLGQYPKGSGIAAALFFAKRGDEVTVTDLKAASALRDNVRQLKKFKNVRFALGRHDLKDVRSADLIVRNPRVRSGAPEIKMARRLGVPIESDITLFLDRCPATVIGVTGTRGKSTTSALLFEMLKADGRRVWLGGNILVSPLTFLSKIKKDDMVVLELSSWQLEALGDKGVSPPVAVWTNLMRDHLNTYRGMDEYAEAKAQIFRHQNAEGIVFLPADRPFDRYAQEAPGEVARVGSGPEARLVRQSKMKLLGEHNRRNAEFATAVALSLGVGRAVIKKVLATFKGLPNRFETVAVKHGLTYINDTTATTPDATIAALQTFQVFPSHGIPLRGTSFKFQIHLIFGGADKELKFDEVAREIKRGRVRVALLPGTARAKIVKAFRRAGVVHTDVKDLRVALRVIHKTTKRGDIILLSPGCASFGLFKNEFERGEQFRRLVTRLDKRQPIC